MTQRSAEQTSIETHPQSPALRNLTRAVTATALGIAALIGAKAAEACPQDPCANTEPAPCPQPAPCPEYPRYPRPRPTSVPYQYPYQYPTQYQHTLPQSQPEMPEVKSKKAPPNSAEITASILAQINPKGEAGWLTTAGLRLNFPITKIIAPFVQLDGGNGKNSVTPTAPDGFTVDKTVDETTWMLRPTAGMQFNIGDTFYLNGGAGPQISWIKTEEASLTKNDDPSTRAIESGTSTLGEQQVDHAVDLVITAQTGAHLGNYIKIAATGSYDAAGPNKNTWTIGAGIGIRLGEF